MIAPSSLNKTSLREDRAEKTLISIVGYRNAQDILSCIQALSKSSEKNFSISICENGGQNSYWSLLQTINEVAEPIVAASPTKKLNVIDAWEGRLRLGKQTLRVYCADTNCGYAGGVNLCIKGAQNIEQWAFLWILNPDTEPHSGALAAFKERCSTRGYDILGGRIILKTIQKIQTRGGQWNWIMARGRNIDMYHPLTAIPNIGKIERKIDYVSGASLFVTRRFVQSTGMMDEDYFLYCEEVDWCLRRNNFRIGYVHDAIIEHTGSSTIGSNTTYKERSALSVYLLERNGLLLTRRFFRARFPIVVVTTLILTLRYPVKGAWKNFFIAIKGWFDGVLGRHGRPDEFLKT